MESKDKNDAEKVLTHCHDLLAKGEKLDEALHGFNLLLNSTIHKPANMDVLLFYIGCVHMRMGHHAMAILLFKKAMEVRPNFLAAINNLGYIFKKEGIHYSCRDCFAEVIRIVESDTQDVPDKDKAEYYINFGSSLIANGSPKEALEYFNKATQYNTEKDILKWNRSLANLELGNYEDGFKEYDFGERGDLSRRRLYRLDDKADWDGTPGQRVIVYGEQGIGDEIMFASMLPDFMKDCPGMILDAHPRLTKIFRQNFPNIPVYGTRKTEISECKWLDMHQYDSKIAIGSLAKFYRKKKEDFPRVPYLMAQPEISTKYVLKLAEMSDKPKIGISWRGGIKSTNGSARYIPLNQWIDILQLDADFISLQYNKDAHKEVKEFEDAHGIKLNHWPETLRDYDETAGLVENLDLIISVPQSVVHLAGALGQAVWQLAPYRAMWQVGPYGEDMPWYLSVTNYWQGNDENWQPVLNRVKDDLCNLLAMNI